MGSNPTLSAKWKAEVGAAARLCSGQSSPRLGVKMSDLKDSEILDEVKLAGEHKLEQRVARLKRLMELHAPPIILAREVVLIEKAMWLFDPTAMAAAIETDQVKTAKMAAGFCINSGCQNKLGADHEYCDPCMQTDPDESEDETGDVN